MGFSMGISVGIHMGRHSATEDMSSAATKKRKASKTFIVGWAGEARIGSICSRFSSNRSTLETTREPIVGHQGTHFAN